MVEKRKLSTRLRAVPAWRKSSPIEQQQQSRAVLPGPPERHQGNDAPTPIVVDRMDGISMEDHKLYADGYQLSN
jgi:hypothetical protein